MMNEEEENTAAEVPMDWRQTRRSRFTTIGLASSVGAEKKSPSPTQENTPFTPLHDWLVDSFVASWALIHS